MWELALELPPITLTGRQFVPTDTTHITHMLAHPTGTMARSGLTVEYLLAPDRGITGAGDMTDTGAVRGIGVAATTGEESTHVAAMVAAITEVMRTVVTRAATLEATASVAKVVTTVAAEVASTAAVGEASTEEADPTVADTGNSVMEA